MKIKVLGTRGEIDQSAPYHSKHSGILIDDILLLDCGEESFLKYRPQLILITHLHPDHAFFVRSDEHPLIECAIYAPEKYKNMDIAVKKKRWKWKDYTITPIPTIHSLKVLSNAYLIEHNNQKILYTGDLIWIEKKHHLLLSNLDLVITEASTIRRDGLVRRDKKSGKVFGHAGIPTLIALFKKFTPTILFVHFGSWFYHDIKSGRKKLHQISKNHIPRVIIGYDGAEIAL